MRVPNAFFMAHLRSQKHDDTVCLFVAMVHSSIQSAGYIEHEHYQLVFTSPLTLETMMVVLEQILLS